MLEDCFGREALAKMHRNGPDRTMIATLAQELQAMEKLFYGAHVTVCRQIGMQVLTSPRLVQRPTRRRQALSTGRSRSAKTTTWAAIPA